MHRILILVLTTCFTIIAGNPAAQAEVIGEVSTTWNALTPNDKVAVEVFKDPDVAGVVCYISRAKTGGAASVVGMAEDKSDSSVACRQIGPIAFGNKRLPKQEKVFSERASAIFKTVNVTRMIDAENNVLIYLVTSTRVIEGSPKNSISVVPVPKSQPIPLR